MRTLARAGLVLLGLVPGCRSPSQHLAAPPPALQFRPEPAEWVEVHPRFTCAASAERSALGCKIQHCTRSGALDAGEGVLVHGYGVESVGCGETADVCGRAYRCECQRCSDTPDYATRMTRKRQAVYSPPTYRADTIFFSVAYEDGKCEGVAGTRYGDDEPCTVSAWDDSQVGGCYRHTTDPGTGAIACGASVTVCGGVELRCDCMDGGVRWLTVTGATEKATAWCPAPH